MMKQSHQTSFLFGENVPYIGDLYESYLTDHSSVRMLAMWMETAA